MKSTNLIVYMDACCFIDAVKWEVGSLPADREDDVWHIKKLLEAHRAGDLRVMTSMLSVAECVALESGQAEVPVEAQVSLRRLLTSGQFLILAPQTPKTGQIAQDLRWKQKLVLKGADALHVSTALEVGAQEFLTTDGQLRKPKMAEAAKVLQARGLRFIRAAHTRFIPDRLRQGRLDDE